MKYQFFLSDHEPIFSKTDNGFVALGKIFVIDDEKDLKAYWHPDSCKTLKDCREQLYQIPLQSSLAKVIRPENQVEVYMPPQHMQLYQKDQGSFELIQRETKLFFLGSDFQILKLPQLEIRRMSSQQIVSLQSPLSQALNDVFKQTLPLRVSPNSKLYKEIHLALKHYMLMRWGTQQKPSEFFWDIEGRCWRWQREKWDISLHETTAEISKNLDSNSTTETEEKEQKIIETKEEKEQEKVEVETQKENIQSEKIKDANSSHLRVAEFIRSFTCEENQQPQKLLIKSQNISVGEIDLSLNDIPTTIFSVAVRWLLDPKVLNFGMDNKPLYLEEDGHQVGKDLFSEIFE